MEPPHTYKIVAITREATLATTIPALLPSAEFSVYITADRDDPVLWDREVQAVLVDLGTGVDAVEDLVDRRPGLPLLVLAGRATEHVADGLLESGATDVVMTDGINRGRLQRAVRRAVARHRGAADKFGAVESLLRRYQLMEGLFRIVSQRDISIDEQIDAILREGCRLFRMDLGIVSHIAAAEYTVRSVHPVGGHGIRPGDQFPLGETICALTVESGGPLGIDHLSDSSWRSHPCSRTRLEAYIGTLIAVNGSAYGTLSFSSPRPRGSTFPEIDLAFIDTLGDWVSTLLARAHLLGELHVLATHDSLTGLPNRSGFVEHARAVLRRARGDDGHTVAVLFIDLDKFKQVNDSLGHLAGDRLLQQVATRLRLQIRPGDTVARFGGDEFVVLMYRVTPRQAELAAQRIQRDLRRPFNLSGMEMSISGSIGIAMSHGQDDLRWLLDAADHAMYEAKRTGTVQSVQWAPAPPLRVSAPT